MEGLLIFAHDRALDENRSSLVVHESVRKTVQGPKIKKVVTKACTDSWQEASMNPEAPTQELFVRSWIAGTLARIQSLTRYIEDMLTNDVAETLFLAMLQDPRAVPHHCIAAATVMPEGWTPVVSDAVSQAFRRH